MRYLILKDRKVIDLEDKGVSSWEFIDEKTAQSDEWGCDEAFYIVYYFDENKGAHLEQDDKGGHSMDNFNASEILATCDTPEELLNYETVSIPKVEYERLKEIEKDDAIKTVFVDRFLDAAVESKVGPVVWEKIKNGKWSDIKVFMSESPFAEDPIMFRVAFVMSFEKFDIDR